MVRRLVSYVCGLPCMSVGQARSDQGCIPHVRCVEYGGGGDQSCPCSGGGGSTGGSTTAPHLVQVHLGLASDLVHVVYWLGLGDGEERKMVGQFGW